MTEGTPTPAKKTAAAPLPSAPAAPPKKERVEKLFVAYNAENETEFDAVVFGRKLDALEHASDQDTRWKVVEIVKGQSIRAAIANKS
ncbi:hypothetical protein GCM10022234_00550 [Aeromicrobium panaciterrae]|uniref:hypothetical protein n=1 Tax=Aeromicrobium panaciterrae TaxID=363861 RepID=UPI0031DC67EF